MVNPSPRKRQDGTSQVSNKAKKRFKMAAPGTSKPETKVGSLTKDQRSSSETQTARADAEIKSSNAVRKSTGQDSKEVVTVIKYRCTHL